MNTIDRLIAQFSQEFSEALVTATTEETATAVKNNFLGRHGSLTTLMNHLKNLSVEEKRIYGPQLNTLKETCTQRIYEKLAHLEAEKQLRDLEKLKHFDVTAYNATPYQGSLHPHTHAIHKLQDIFMSMGFEITDGPEIETEFINFEALNIPADHPARDMQDTFWLRIPNMLLRTHTSTVQIHTMHKRTPPLAAVSLGRCYRNEATDASHDYVFMQCEGLYIDKNVSMSNLLAVTRSWLQAFFGNNALEIRIRPSFFPFVEPGVEIDCTCPFCTQGCSTCKHTGWIELGGAGLIHPNVLRAGSIDPEIYSGFAFGFGLTRLVMLMYGIKDIRLLHEGSLEFLKQF